MAGLLPDGLSLRLGPFLEVPRVKSFGVAASIWELRGEEVARVLPSPCSVPPSAALSPRCLAVPTAPLVHCKECVEWKGTKKNQCLVVSLHGNCLLTG